MTTINEHSGKATISGDSRETAAESRTPDAGDGSRSPFAEHDAVRDPVHDAVREPVRDAVRPTYVALIIALVLAGALSSGRMVETAERLPFGPARDPLVTLAMEAHDLAQRAGLNWPALAIDNALSAAKRAEPQVAATTHEAVKYMLSALSDAMSSAGTGAPGWLANRMRVNIGSEHSGPITVPPGDKSSLDALGEEGEDDPAHSAADTRLIDSSTEAAGDPSPAGREGPPTHRDGSPVDRAGLPVNRKGSRTHRDGPAAQETPASRTLRSPADRTRAALRPTVRRPASTPRRTEVPMSAEEREIARISTLVPAPRRLSAFDPLRVHVAGDSMAQPLGYALQRLVVDDPRISVTLDFHISTGLVRQDYFDWPARISDSLTQRQGLPDSTVPEVIVFFVGGNENQNMRIADGTVLVMGSPEWGEAYGQRAAEVMDIAGRNGARVIWIGMPVVREPNFNDVAQRMNDAVSMAAAARPWVSFVDIWDTFAGPDGGFAPFQPGPGGARVQVRDEDGIHLSPEGTRFVGRLVFEALGGMFDVRTPTPTSTATAEPTATATGMTKPTTTATTEPAAAAQAPAPWR